MEDALGDVVGSEEELARVVRLIEAAPTIKDAKLMLDNFDIIRHRHYLGVPGWRGCKRKRTHDDVRSIFVPVLLRNGAKVAMKSWKCQDHDNCRKAGFVIRDWYTWYIANGWSGKDDEPKPVDAVLQQYQFHMRELGFVF